MSTDTLFKNREKPWQGLGKNVSNAPNSATALQQAGLDWDVVQRPILVSDRIIEEYVANVREDNNNVLGIVSKHKYKVVQNREAFSFTDSLIGGDVRYETAGSLAGGKKVWLLAQLPEAIIIDDKVIPYVCFTNSHNGKGSVRVLITPVRVACQNTLNLAIRTAPRTWSTIHAGNINAKIEEAQRTLELTNHYIKELSAEAEILATQRVNNLSLHRFIKQLLPIPDGVGKQKESNIKALRDELMIRYNDAPDMQNIKGTAWGLINAVSDLATHIKPKRASDTFQVNLFEKTINGHPLIDKAYDLLRAA